MYEEVVEEGRDPRVPRSKGPMDQVISKFISNTSLTLKKVHLVLFLIFNFFFVLLWHKLSSASIVAEAGNVERNSIRCGSANEDFQLRL